MYKLFTNKWAIGITFFSSQDILFMNLKLTKLKFNLTIKTSKMFTVEGLSLKYIKQFYII